MCFTNIESQLFSIVSLLEISHTNPLCVAFRYAHFNLTREIEIGLYYYNKLQNTICGTCDDDVPAYYLYSSKSLLCGQRNILDRLIQRKGLRVLNVDLPCLGDEY